MKKSKLLLALIFILAFILRFANLGKIPAGFYSDEASLGYNAYSLYKTGRDEYGAFLPLSFKSFGEYKAPLYVYTSVPLVALFGLSEFSTRLTSALFGFLTVVVIYFLAKQIFKNEHLALITAFILSVSPWHLQFSRIAYEGSLTLFLLSLGTLFFLKGLEKGFFLYLSAVLFTLMIYSHYTIRAFMPFYALVLIIIFWKKIIRRKKDMIISGLLALIFLLPILPDIFSPAGLTRANYISLFTDKGLVSAIEQKRSEHLWSNQNQEFIPKILHNRFTEHSLKFIDNYLSHFDFSFLFEKGDESQLFKTPNSGLLLLSWLPFLLIGFYKLFQRDDRARGIILTWIILAPIPSSLTRLTASANRAFIMVIPMMVIVSLGILSALQDIKSRYKKLLLTILVLVMLGEYIFYLDNYYTHLSLRYARDTFVVTKSVVQAIDSLSDNYHQVWMSHKLGGYIHLLFHLQYPPALYQQQAKLSPLNEYGFGLVEGFGKYVFRALPKYLDSSPNTLYVVPPEELPEGITPLKNITYPDGSSAFIIFAK